MEIVKRTILEGIEKKSIKDTTDCMAILAGWYKREGMVPVEMLDWVLQLFFDGKIEG